MANVSFGAGGDLWKQPEEFSLGNGDERFGNAFEHKYRIQSQKGDTNVNRANAYQAYQEGMINDRRTSNNIEAQKNPFYGDSTSSNPALDEANRSLSEIMQRGAYAPGVTPPTLAPGMPTPGMSTPGMPTPAPVNQEQRATNAKNKNASATFMNPMTNTYQDRMAPGFGRMGGQ